LVAYFIKEVELRNKLVPLIKQAGDIERLVSKLPLKKINPREVLQIARGLQQTAAIKELCAGTDNAYLQRLADHLDSCPAIAGKILRELTEQPPATAQKGGMIASGIDEELDTLRNIARNGKEYLQQL